MTSEAETALVAVERVSEYAVLKAEGEGEGEGGGEGKGEGSGKAVQSAPPDGWPAHGALALTDLRMAYRADTPEVLAGVTLAIPAGARVGIVGRTGAGKSSLIAALLRTADVQAGKIEVDGVDTRRVPRGALRRAISYVPQEAVLFSGSVRKNLDVLGAHGGAEGEGRLWAALQAVGLAGGGAGGGPPRIEGSLEAVQVGEGGGNFSAGERQLLCIARAMLKRARVVVMDEATASVDAAGDERVQGAMQQAFQGATQLIVAHRINTVLGCDYILCMDRGRVGEWGKPEELLRREGGLFRCLVEESARKGGGGASGGSGAVHV